jgi:uncharacterized 2Fe-2S/4Fe-4S cluster protein (DUF4445 family)
MTRAAETWMAVDSRPLNSDPAESGRELAGASGATEDGHSRLPAHLQPTSSEEASVAIRIEPAGRTVRVPSGTVLETAILQAGLNVSLPCGGQGRCGRCAVEVREGEVRRRSTLRLRDEDIAKGIALACQTVATSDVTIWIPPERERFELVEQADKAEKAAPDIEPCRHHAIPWVERHLVVVNPPTMGDNTPDLERLQREFVRQLGLVDVAPSLTALGRLPQVLRESGWAVTAEIARIETDPAHGHNRLVDVLPGRVRKSALGVAIDIGTTTVAGSLVDLSSGKVLDQASAFNSQIDCGEDVISRIMYAKEPERRRELQRRVLDSVNGLIDLMAERQGLAAHEIAFATVAGNTTMIHLFLGLEPAYIRLEPYIPAAGHFMPVLGSRLGLHIHPEATVDCLPAVGAYVGGDITAGVLRSGMHEEEPVTLFIDVGTNGEMVLGNSEWLISCACSAGPAFEGAGAGSGMRAEPGAIDEVWIDPLTLEPTVHTLGDVPPIGICGSGMISALGELMVVGIIDKSGRIAAEGLTDRVRRGHNGLEYVVVWAAEEGEADVVLDETDIQNLMRAKAAIYAGATVLCESVGMTIGDVERVFIGGGFGRYIDVEKAVQIGLLPDLPWERFSYLGNTSLQGAYLALTCREHRAQAEGLAAKMTYLELSADNRFMDAFTSALFLPHTDEALFPSVSKARGIARQEGVPA